MDVQLKELLNRINYRFTGPESCRMQDMINGKIDLDVDEIKNYLQGLHDFGGLHGNYSSESYRKEAISYLNEFTEFIDNRKKSRV